MNNKTLQWTIPIAIQTLFPNRAPVLHIEKTDLPLFVL